MKKFGVDKFAFEIIAEVEPGSLKVAEQKFIENLQPTYNNRNANGYNIERRKETKKEYRQSEKGKESHNKYQNQLCYFNGETLTINALSTRFKRRGIPHPTIEAKKYLVVK